MKTVAKTILEQLGGANRLSIMTGAADFVGAEDGLTFTLPGRLTLNGISVVHITLRNDLYDIEFLRVRGSEVKTISTAEQVPVENLQKTFTRHTGLQVNVRSKLSRRFANVLMSWSLCGEI